MVADRETAHSKQTMVIGLMIRSVDRVYIYISAMSTRVITLLYMCVYIVRTGKWLSMSRNKPTNEVAFLFCPKHCVWCNIMYIIVLWPSAQDGLVRTQIISSDFDKFIYNTIGDNFPNDFRQTNTNLYIIMIHKHNNI